MRLDWFGDDLPAVVRGRELRRHKAHMDEARSAAVVLIAQGPPRAWQRSLDAARQGIREASESATDAESLLAGASRVVKRRGAAMLDEAALQTHGAALSISKDGDAEIATAGSCRTYLDRGGSQRRVSSKEASPGLLDGFAFSRRVERLRPGDVLVLAPSHLLGEEGMVTLGKALHDRSSASAKDIVRAMLASCTDSGGAVVAVKVL